MARNGQQEQQTRTRVRKDFGIVGEQRTFQRNQNYIEGLHKPEEEYLVDEGPYEEFFEDISELPQRVAAGEGEPPQEPKPGYKERKRRREKFDKILKENKQAPHFATDDEKEALAKLLQTKQGREYWANTKIGDTSLTRQEILQQIINKGDCSNFELLDNFSRNLVAEKALKQMMEMHPLSDTSWISSIGFEIMQRGKGVSGLMNPALRLGISLACQSPHYDRRTKQLLRSLDTWMTTTIMEKTLLSAPQKEDLKAIYMKPGVDESEAGYKARCVIAENKAQQIQIAKRLLLMHLSDFKVKRTDENNQVTYTPWVTSVSVALSHCSRVALTLPEVKPEEEANTEKMHHEMWESIFDVYGGNYAEDNRRGSSTHKILRRKVSQLGDVKESKEEKKLCNFFGQRGMNCAIGGLGNAGVGGKMLLNDGTCGHFYSMYEEGDRTHYGAMLMGIESDAFAKKNQLGHVHTIFATREKASSFGAQRTDEIGDKYGGRQCDLTKLSAQEIKEWMELLERAMREWQKTTKDMKRGELAMKMLAGPKMSKERLAEFRWELRHS